MNLNGLKTIVITMLCLVVWASADAAKPAPRWVQKGENEIGRLNKKRSNDTYAFRLLQQSDADEDVIELNRFKPLLDYVNSAYGVSQDKMVVDSVVLADDRTVYTVSFDRGGQSDVVYAQLVDEYTRFDTHVNGAFDYDNYQLYALSSEPGVMPDYDNFTLTRRYNAAQSTVMSLIPGLGQIHKGQKVKGYTIMGCEALFIGGIIYSSIEMKNRHNLAWKYPEGTLLHNSYISNEASFKHLRNVCIIVGAGLYVYNLLDAAFANGARYVKVQRKESPNMELTFVPVASSEMAGVGLSLRF